MAVRRCAHDRRDSEQWHAVPPASTCNRRHCPRRNPHRFPRCLGNVHKLGPHPVQAAPSSSTQHGRRRLHPVWTIGKRGPRCRDSDVRVPSRTHIRMLNSTSFAVFASGSQLLAGQISLAALSDNKLCLMLYTGIFAVPTLLLSFPRTLDQLGWMCIPSCISILVAGVVGMAAAGAFPVPAADRQIAVTVTTSFYTAFIAITNPVFVSSSTLASFLWGCLPPRTLLEYIV